MSVFAITSCSTGTLDANNGVESQSVSTGLDSEPEIANRNISEELNAQTETVAVSQRVCPTDINAEQLLPGVTQEMLSPDYWANDDRVIIDQKSIQKQNGRFYNQMNDLNTPVPQAILETNMRERLNSFKKKFENDEIMFVDGTRPDLNDFSVPLEEFKSNYDSEKIQQYILLEDATILCGPHDQPYIKTQNGEVRFSRNNCSLARAQSRVEIIFTHTNGMRFIRTGQMWGWLSPNAPLSPVLPHNKLPEEGRWFATQAFERDGLTIPKGAFLAGTKNEVWLANKTGWQKVLPTSLPGMIDTQRPLTRKAWVETLMLFLGDPYGWGGYDGWRDCSRLLLDAALSFGIHLPRNSKEQAVQTTYYLKVAGMSPEAKLKSIDDAAQTGIVFLHFPGHIMAYLGRNRENKPIIIHALSEYIQACKDAPTDAPEDTLVHVDRVVLSDLSLGENSSRTSFLERITHVSVITNISRDSNNSMNVPWQVTHDWNPQEETLFAAFFERLFDYPEEPDKTWTNLGDVLRDRNHNILYNSLGQNEERNIKLAPDCADLPYMLRAYFAWKRGLPMGVRKCSRGTEKQPPKCGSSQLMQDYHVSGDEATRFNKYARYVGAYQVHSGNARTALEDDKTDFYPVELTRNSLRSGQIYADPHGHILMIAHYTPDTAEALGALLSVDAQPDGTITRKRFWKGNFLFDPSMKNVGAGFKAFRPMKGVSQLTNEALSVQSGFVPYSFEQKIVQKEVFYDRVEAAIHPKPLPIVEAVAELTSALHESAERRVLNVQNGDDYINANGASHMIMPNGYAVFETVGPWEDFATPSRDMRMLVAIDAVRDFPDQIARNAERYNLNTPEELQAALDEAKRLIDEALSSNFIVYKNSKGEPVQLSMKAIVERAENLEMAYHPADCNELRWGAPKDSEEYKTCSRVASPSERAKMDTMRIWFHKRTRPAR